MPGLEELKRRIDEALVLMRDPKGDYDSYEKGTVRLDAVMAEIGLPRHGSNRDPNALPVPFTKRHIGRAADLDATQRAVVEHIARVPRLRLY